MKQLMAGGGVALIGMILVPLLKGLFGYSRPCRNVKPFAPARLTRAGAGKEG